MSDKNNEGKLLANLESIASSLEKMTLLKEVDMLYSSDDRTRIVREFHALRDADAAAFANMQSVRAQINTVFSGAWDDRVKKFGEVEAKKQYEPYEAALEARKAVTEKSRVLRERHPLIARLMQAYPFLSNPELEPV